VILDNLTAASRALNGRIYDLLDATVDRAGFDFGAAMAAAHRDPDAVAQVLTAVPDTETLVARAKEIVADEDQLRTPVNPREAIQPLASDRLQAINPVIVSAFVDQVAPVEGWTVTTGPTPGIRVLRSSQSPLPETFGGGTECLIAADAGAVIKAREEQFGRAGDVIVLGPTEEEFQELVKRASRHCAGDLLAGAPAVDLASLTSYTLFAYAADFEHHEGVRRTRRNMPFLIRCSGAGGPLSRSSWRPSSTSTGSTTGASTKPAVTYRPPNLRTPTTVRPAASPRPH
jgi:hypothetical protein